MTNVVVVRGRLSRPAAMRVLASGEHMVELQVAVAAPTGGRESVPVVWPAAPASAGTLDQDAEVTVVGRVRQRFFRTGGATQSRTEVVAEQVVPSRQRARARAAVARVARRLDEPAPS